MATEQTMLQLLQSRSIVDCDTMDCEVPQTLGPFVDCTSNQAIAYFELQKPVHRSLIESAQVSAQGLAHNYPEVSVKELAVEIAMVRLQLNLSRFITGFVHVQINPYYSYDTERTVKNARRIIDLVKHCIPDSNDKFDHTRVCIKIPSTWEGLQACRILEASKITTLATTLFTVEQASLAGEVKCHYIAPYVNELQVHFEAGFVDHNKAQKLCVHVQRLYAANGIKTEVLPASLTSTAEVMELAGVHHITISPGLLQQLADKPASSNATVSLFDGTESAEEVNDFVKYADDEAKYRIAFTRSNGGDGEGERKLVQAINIFCGMQDKLEEMMK
ncbi:related to transaldolase [Rhynchosporium secalis]|uniref:Transaldolase n=1 Tax=Rhynchosporium secalis TaxID=38038 RepID=A0A1E1MFA8_RHYSE|nr:related to transaldolase [Rhynchosporium secalis]